MAVSVATEVALKVADEAWVATALLHRERPERPDFSIAEIVERARKEHPASPLRPGVQIHAQMHCVANLPPKPNRYRMLFATAAGRRRLFRPGDPFDPMRENSKAIPQREELPERYQPLLAWYEQWVRSHVRTGGRFDGLLRLRGSGRDLWAKEHADEYVRRLREGWE